MKKDKKIKKYLRTSAHTIKFSNTGKLNTYSDFLKEYRNISQIFIDFIWDDADINAAINHEFELPFIPEWVMKSGLNHQEGFFWKFEGFFDKDGVDFRVPLFQNEEKVNIL